MANSRGGRSEVQFEEDGCLKEVLSRELFVALKRVARDFGLRFEMDSSRQFATKLYTIQAVD